MIYVKDLESRREAILEEMRAIRSMKRGTINEQFLKVPHKGRKEPVLRGPYYMFTRREGGRTVGKRLTTPAELAQVRADLAAHKRFIALCKEFGELTEKLGELERLGKDDDQKKKRRSSPSNKTRK